MRETQIKILEFVNSFFLTLLNYLKQLGVQQQVLNEDDRTKTIIIEEIIKLFKEASAIDY